MGKDGLMQFDLAVRDLPRRLTENDVKDLAQGTPLARLPAEKKPVANAASSPAGGGPTQ